MSPLIISGYECSGLTLDLYGTRDEDGVDIEAITLHEDDRDISDLIDSKLIDAIAVDADYQLADNAREHNAQAYADQYHCIAC